MSTKMDRREALEILGLDPDISHEARAVVRAYQERLAVYQEGALASYALMDEAERAARLDEIQAAFQTLDAEEKAQSAVEAEPSPSLPPFDPASPGACLRRAREHLRLDLDDVANRTRILRAHLAALEEERYEQLPPPAYVRGFALQYARALGIAEAEALAHAVVARLREAV